jgi:arabinofuranan 3-O-arabinosyltransferase
LECGEGPTLYVDGTQLQTAVEGTLGALEQMQPLQLTSCGGAIRLGAGEHKLQPTAEDWAGVSVTTLTIAPPGPTAAASAPRTTQPVHWGAESRSVRVGAGAASYLAVSENFNDGWSARLGGRDLKAVRLDGWRQAWEMPAGAGGTVKMSFGPGRLHRGVLWLGGIGVLCLLACAFYPRREPEPAARAMGEATVFRAARLPEATGAVVVGVLGFLLGGVIGAVIGVVAVRTVAYWRKHIPIVAGASFALAGIVAAWNAGAAPGSGSGAFGALAQGLALVALIAVAVSLLPERQVLRPTSQ